MKRRYIKIKPCTIVLGIFDTDTFRYFNGRANVASYNTFINWYERSTIIQTVTFACNKAEMIIFVLDDVQFPIDPQNSYTCSELELICKNEKFFNKTIFVKGKNVIDFDKNLVLN